MIAKNTIDHHAIIPHAAHASYSFVRTLQGIMYVYIYVLIVVRTLCVLSCRHAMVKKCV